MKISNPIYVQKYGGTSVSDVDRLKKIAKRIKQKLKPNDRLVVVVSAMGKTTDNLTKLAYEITPNPAKREMDMLLSTGEQISISLLAMALHTEGISAISFLAFQVNIVTDDNYSNARIKKIDTQQIKQAFKTHQVCLVAGFQGIGSNQNVTTLGRGGSDITAVALAAELSAKECEIYTDVDGVYTANPAVVSSAKKLEHISYDEMLEFASLGAGVLHSRCVEFAKKYSVILHVRSSYNIREGTLVNKGDKNMEEIWVTGVTLKDDEAQISVIDIPDKPGIAAQLFTMLAEKNIVVDMIVQSIGKNQMNTISFTVTQNNLREAQDIVKECIQLWKQGELEVKEEIAILSVIGIGMKSHSGVAAKTFLVLSQEKINILMVSTSEIKISCVIDKEQAHRALNVVHKAFIE